MTQSSHPNQGTQPDQSPSPREEPKGIDPSHVPEGTPTEEAPEAEISLIEALFDRNPLDLTRTDMNAIVSHSRRLWSEYMQSKNRKEAGETNRVRAGKGARISRAKKPVPVPSLFADLPAAPEEPERE